MDVFKYLLLKKEKKYKASIQKYIFSSIYTESGYVLKKLKHSTTKKKVTNGLGTYLKKIESCFLLKKNNHQMGT